MKIAIRNSGVYGKRAYEIIRDNFNADIICFMEDINYIQEDSVCGVPVYTQYKVKKMYEEHIVDTIVVAGNMNVPVLNDIKKELHGFGINSGDIIVIPVDVMLQGGLLDDIHKKQLLEHHQFNYLEYLEFHVTDRCNLNCNNCTHFSSYVEDKNTIENFESVKNDFIRLKQLVDNIQTIRILGGESLLNPELDKYIKMVKQIYPKTNLSIVTNGLLIRQMSEELKECIRSNDVTIAISSYKPMWSKMDEIQEYLSSNNLKFFITQPFSHFYKVVDFENRMLFPYASLRNLPNCMCNNLYRGSLAICPVVCFAGYYDKHYNTNKMQELCKDGVFSIYELNTFDELDERLNKPCGLCDYCTVYRAEQDEKLQEEWRQV